MEVNIVHKIHAGKNPLLAVGGGGGYKTRCNLHLVTLVPEVVLDFSPREKERALTSELRDSFSPLVARFQHLTNISVIMYETVSPDIFSAPPREMNAAFLEPFSFFQLPVQKCSTLCWYSRIPTSLTLEP